MKNLLSTALLVSLALITGGASAQIIVGNLGLEKLPPASSRKVVGAWLLKEMRCTRSIEQAYARYFMVARCEGVRNSDDQGVLLLKQADNHYHSPANGWSYVIEDNGALQIRNRTGAVVLTGVAQANPPSLWP